jgi:hypothetical protein
MFEDLPFVVFRRIWLHLLEIGLAEIAWPMRF